MATVKKYKKMKFRNCLKNPKKKFYEEKARIREWEVLHVPQLNSKQGI